MDVIFVKKCKKVVQQCVHLGQNCFYKNHTDKNSTAIYQDFTTLCKRLCDHKSERNLVTAFCKSGIFSKSNQTQKPKLAITIGKKRDYNLDYHVLGEIVQNEAKKVFMK